MATTRYSLIQGLLWGLYAPLFAFASVFLLSKGLTNTQVGYVIAAGSAASVLLQPLAGSYADRSRRNVLHKLIMSVSLLMVLMSVGILAGGEIAAVSAVLFALLITAIFVITPLTYSLGIFYMERGIHIDFGISRGTGSLIYAVTATAIGMIVAKTDERVVVWSIIIFCVLLSAAVGTFHFRGVAENNGMEQAESAGSKKRILSFLKGHAAFMMILIGVVVAFVNHNIIGFYMYQIVSWHGYGSRELGFASTVMAVCEIPALFGLSFFNRKVSTASLLKLSVICMMLKTVFLLLAQNLAMIYLALCLQFPGYGIFAGISILYVKESIEEGYQSTAQTMLSSAIAVGSVIGSIMGGWLLDQTGVRGTLTVSVICGLIGALFICIFSGRCTKQGDEIA